METVRLWAHQPHRYEDFARHQIFEWPGNAWREVPDDVAAVLLEGHPTRFCDISESENPDIHTCGKGVYEHRMMVSASTVGHPRERMAPGRRKNLTKAMHGRGRKARIAAREK